MGQTATNLGTAGSVLDAQYGSTTGADTNDPLLLEHDGTNYLYLPGVLGNYALTPDAPALNITGDMEIVVRVALADWTAATSQGFVAKFDGPTGAGRAYVLRTFAATAGTIEFLWFDSGTATFRSFVSDAPVPFSADGAGWLRFTFDADNGAAGCTGRFFVANDQATEPTSWTQLGTDRVLATTATISTGSFPVVMGSDSTGVRAITGKFYRAIIRNGIGGTVVFDADFTTGITSGSQTTFTESSSNAATVTINRSSSGRKSVAVVRDVWLFGTDDYMEVADNDLLDFGASDSFTVVAVVRQWGSPSFQALVSKKPGGGVSQGYWLVADSGSGGRRYIEIGDGATGFAPGVTGVPFGTLDVIAGVRDAGSLFASVDGTSGTPVAAALNLSNTQVLRVGFGVGGNTSDMEFLAGAIFRRALSADEIASIANYYGAS
jgi:hypothetical protein